MAKQSNSVNSNGDVKHGMVYSTPDIFTTSTGAKVRFIGLNQQRLETLQNAGKEPPVPKRRIPNDLGGEQVEDLTANELLTPEEVAAWKEYEEKTNFIRKKREENVLKYTFTSGFEVLDLDDAKLDEWKWEEENVWGNEVPGNRIDILLQYINTKVIGNNDDYVEIMAGIMERTGVPAHMLDELRDTFRGKVRENTASEVNAEQGTEG